MPSTGYDRMAAKEYAEKYALSPNLKDYPYYKSDDCTNFVSQVLKAGGMQEIGSQWDNFNSWFCRTKYEKELKKVAITWRAARYFMRHWGNEDGMGDNRAYGFYRITPEEAISNFLTIYNNFDVGDVIQYGNPLPYHTQVIHNKVFNPFMGQYDFFVAQHTVNRLNVSLYGYILKLLGKDNIYIYLYKL
ncbi:amidase domain-containing protein [Haloimpatiens lingqiaonensis]|uniref:amidase domain-containing protein n=1 Tax=Haloimpatiens lingqiaonensis TaxID=1380675 RepID=UPI0010FD8902|nr:amidase domain-containing protein [Haloimpatiens lingqiaonensis]